MRLPDDYLVRRLRDQWAVVGPTGLFVVGRPNGDPASAARRTVAVAHELRDRLAEQVPWVPFVEPIVVTEGDSPVTEGTSVAIEDLESILTNGPVVIDGMGLHQLRHHLPGVVQAMELEQVGPTT